MKKLPEYVESLVGESNYLELLVEKARIRNHWKYSDRSYFVL